MIKRTAMSVPRASKSRSRNSPKADVSLRRRATYPSRQSRSSDVPKSVPGTQTAIPSGHLEKRNPANPQITSPLNIVIRLAKPGKNEWGRLWVSLIKAMDIRQTTTAKVKAPDKSHHTAFSGFHPLWRRAWPAHREKSPVKSTLKMKRTSPGLRTFLLMDLRSTEFSL